MMDDAAFLRLDFAEIAKNGTIDDNTLGGIAAIRNGSFNPENVGAEAKQKLLFESIVGVIKQFKSDPSDDFIRFILGCSTVGGKISKVTQKIVDANRDLVRSAMEAFVAQEALARFGYAPKDVVRTLPEPPPVAPSVAAAEPNVEGIVATDRELNSLVYAKNRLYYLIRSEALFAEVEKITFKKTRATFRVYYVKPNSGSIFDYKELKNGMAIAQFPSLSGEETPFVPSPKLDECLLNSFSQRVMAAGVTLEPSPVLRAIAGGQSNGAT